MNNQIKNLSNGDFQVVPLDDSEFLAAQKRREDALMTRMAELGQEMERAREENEKRIDEWWNNLPYEQQCDAFYAVVKRIYQAEIIDRGTYRYALYDVFGFGPEMYGAGMDCGYMALHNSIMTDEEYDSSELDIENDFNNS